MFNRVAQREFATAHIITGNMSKSRKRFPAGTCCCCKSQKRGKQISHRKFRRREHVLMHNQHFEKLPRLQYEITRQWDLGGDGKCFWGWAPEEEWFQKEMRKWGCNPLISTDSHAYSPPPAPVASQTVSPVQTSTPQHSSAFGYASSTYTVAFPPNVVCALIRALIGGICDD